MASLQQVIIPPSTLPSSSPSVTVYKPGCAAYVNQPSGAIVQTSSNVFQVNCTPNSSFGASQPPYDMTCSLSGSTITCRGNGQYSALSGRGFVNGIPNSRADIAQVADQVCCPYNSSGPYPQPRPQPRPQPQPRPDTQRCLATCYALARSPGQSASEYFNKQLQCRRACGNGTDLLL